MILQNPALKVYDYRMLCPSETVLLAVDLLQLLEFLKEPVYLPNKFPLLCKLA
jgi:hypothetical protein